MMRPAMRKRPAGFFSRSQALTLMVSAAVLANNPIAVNSDGNATKWGTFPITYTTDGGNAWGARQHSRRYAHGFSVRGVGRRGDRECDGGSEWREPRR